MTQGYKDTKTHKRKGTKTHIRTQHTQKDSWAQKHKDTNILRQPVQRRNITKTQKPKDKMTKRQIHKASNESKYAKKAQTLKDTKKHLNVHTKSRRHNDKHKDTITQ